MSVGTAAVDDFEAQQRQRLVKSMRLFDLVFFGVATVVSLDTIGYISGFGAQTFTWMLVLVPLFVLPHLQSRMTPPIDSCKFACICIYLVKR